MCSSKNFLYKGFSRLIPANSSSIGSQRLGVPRMNFRLVFEKWAAALPRPCAHFSKIVQKGKLLGNVSHGIVLYSKLGYFKAQCSRHGGGYWILFFAFGLHMLHGHDFQTLLLSLRTQNCRRRPLLLVSRFWQCTKVRLLHSQNLCLILTHTHRFRDPKFPKNTSNPLNIPRGHPYLGFRV